MGAIIDCFSRLLYGDTNKIFVRKMQQSLKITRDTTEVIELSRK